MRRSILLKSILRKASRLLCLTLLTQWLISCTTLPNPAPSTPQIKFSAHQQQLAQAEHWTLKGKIGFKSKQEVLSATLLWQQQQDQFYIRLSGMLGTTLMEMNGREGLVELHVDGKDYTDSNAEQLLKRITGWQLPLDQLSLLIKGQVPQTDFKVTEATKNWPLQVQEKQQNVSDASTGSTFYKPWKIRYNQFQATQTESKTLLWLPYDLKLTKAQNLIKIRVTSWEVH